MAVLTVVHSWFAEENKPCDNGSDVVGVFTDLKSAIRCLRKEARKWKKEQFSALQDIDEEDWKPGFRSDPDGSSWSKCAFEDFKAWATNDCASCFEKVEIIETTKKMKKILTNK